jgi:hypothetical protein
VRAVIERLTGTPSTGTIPAAEHANAPAPAASADKPE